MGNKNVKLIVAALVVLAVVFWFYADKNNTLSTLLSGQDEAPTGQLGQDVEPIKYKLDFVIDPRQDRFSGTSEIDVQFNTSQSYFWLHGANLNVTSLTATIDGGEVITGTFQQVDDTGVAKVSFDRKIPMGVATLVINYDAPFNPSLEGIYKVERIWPEN